MKTERITCDGCGADLKPPRRYWLSLHPEGVHRAGAIMRDHHFCELGCLDQWRSRGQHIALAWHEWRESRVVVRGNLRCHPPPTEEERAEVAAEFEAAALAAFPMRRVG